ncbi:MAG: cobalamin B12-binding domain-containing protein [Planctomycetota bacterium]|jgi:methanogenic corrinoid protein MtbC1
MRTSEHLEPLLRSLLAGDRVSCRAELRERLAGASDVRSVYFDLLWPAMEQVEKLYRAHRINQASEHMATRIMRVLADQLQASLPLEPANGKRILVACADGEPEELGAQMCADLFEANGWSVYFIGGGVPDDEILSLVGQLRPEILLMFGTQPQGVPRVRRLIELIREVNSNPTMNIVVSAGVFNRADGLWKEVNADLFAKNAAEALVLAEKLEPRKPEVKIPGAPKKRRRRRRPPLLVTAEATA